LNKTKIVEIRYNSVMDAYNLALVYNSSLIDKNWFLSALNPSLRFVMTNCSSKDLIKHIENWMDLPENLKNKIAISEQTYKIEKYWNNIVGPQMISFLEFLYQKPFDFDKITAYSTSAPMADDDYKKNQFFFMIKNSSQELKDDSDAAPLLKYSASIILHELNHFMFHKHYGYLEKELSSDNFWILKESITFFSNPFSPGYPKEKPLRDFYSSLNCNEYSLDKIIKMAIKKVLK